MKTIRQITSVAIMNIHNIPMRMSQSLVVVFGIAGVVAVLIVILAMGEGFLKTMRGTGFEDRAVILRDGSTSEINGSITFEQAAIISNLAGISNINGEPLLAGESYVSVNLFKKSGNEESSVGFRGVSPQSFLVRDEVEIVAGRMNEPGKFELLVSKGAANEFRDLEVGSTLVLRNISWEVVGVFDAGGSVFDSEIWGDVLLLNSAFGRGSTYSSLALRLNSAAEFSTLEAAISADPRLTTWPLVPFLL